LPELASDLREAIAEKSRVNDAGVRLAVVPPVVVEVAPLAVVVDDELGLEDDPHAASATTALSAIAA
jgi:hypothetical protein